jgi:hypothetical protein
MKIPNILLQLLATRKLVLPYRGTVKYINRNIGNEPQEKSCLRISSENVNVLSH